MPLELKPCGTVSAYFRHRNRCEETCGPCRAAWAAWCRAYRAHQTVQPCACCGEPGIIVARGWRNTCHRRWLRAGRPAGGPPPGRGHRQREYDHLRDGGVSPEQAALRLGAPPSTADRWERARRQAVTT